jgi:hypothetical protein
MTRLRTSPMLATWLCSSSASTNACAGLDTALDLERETAPVPLGAYFLPARATGSTAAPA